MDEDVEKHLRKIWPRLLKFYEGGLTAEYLDNLPLPEVFRYAEEMRLIAKEMEPKTRSGRNGF